MKSERGTSGRLVRLGVFLFLVLWLAEAVTKVLAVLQEYTGADLKSTVTSRLGEGLRVLAPAVLAYLLTLLAIYVLFGALNGHYAALIAARVSARRPGRSRFAPGLAFLAVNAVFLAGLYSLNSALYPASNLAFVRQSLLWVGDVGALKTAGLALLAVYLAGFVVMSVRTAGKKTAIASLAFWGVLLVAPLDPAYLLHRALPRAEAVRPAAPNVILIGIDSLNPLHTGYAGYPLPLTPNLDAFLKENVVFRDCYTSIARTFPSWYSILTGQYPVTNGVRLNLQKRKNIKSADRCLGHILKDRGYRTVHFTDEVRFSNITSAEGFDVLRHPVMGIKDFVFGSFHDFSLTNVFFNNPLGSLLFPFLKYNRAVFHLYDGRYFINDVVAELDRLKRGKPFFLAVHLCIGHWPYFHASPREFKFQPGADPRMALYDSALSIADRQLGRILAALKASGLYDGSVVVVLSDHGESAEGHGSDLRNSEQNRTLLAWKPAGGTVHRDVDRLVRTIDIAPTILELVGAGTAGRAFDGESLRPWLGDPGVPEPADDRSVFMETEFSLLTPGGLGIALQSMIEQGIKFYEFDRTGLITVRDDIAQVLIRRRNRALMTSDWKLVRDVVLRGSSEIVRTALFDLCADPACKEDVAAERPEIFRSLWDRLSRYYGSELAPPAAEPGGAR
ncbi:MAG TPA: sulfatase [Candidatus Aminicenantes bacterium]|nr:sulfatase [Candidatus Aminicenantes bacterium]HRY64300.1 sulfatase [Candidatus Aminicenantes bacterium]HRZ71213.1 sulfatase [Candidatus Aminicenantes bacterium]